MERSAGRTISLRNVELRTRSGVLTVDRYLDLLADRRRYTVAGDAQVRAHVQPRDTRHLQRLAFPFRHCVTYVQRVITVQRWTLGSSLFTFARDLRRADFSSLLPARSFPLPFPPPVIIIT